MDYIMTHSMDKLYLGDRVVIEFGTNKSRLTGVLTKWDDVAVYVNGLGFARECVSDLFPA
jgi:hypothetical protein